MMKFNLPPLPFEPSSMTELFSQKQLEVHYHTHHMGYIKKVNDFLEKNRPESFTLWDVIQNPKGHSEIFNAGAQAWNHTMLWASLTPTSTKPSSDFQALLAKSSFKTMEGLKQAFIDKGAGHFASGWVWITRGPEGHLDVISTPNAETPVPVQHTPLIMTDVWEHAYYLDYQADRKRYLDHCWSKLNWNLANEILRDPSQLKKLETSMH
ncbi:MAG: superoxide dismutase [Bdellovibrionales bacterium]